MEKGNKYFFTVNKLPKAGILRGHNSFNSVFENSSKANSGFIRAFFSAANSEEQKISESPSASIQTGFVVSKKKIKSAVLRNRVKRLLKEAYRLERTGILSDDIKGSYTIVFTLTESGFDSFINGGKLEIAKLRSDMNRIFTKIFSKNF